MKSYSKPAGGFPKDPYDFLPLLRQLVRREVSGRYRGSLLGIGWAFLNPLVMLAIYTFVFGFVFQTRWPGLEGEQGIGFAVALFAGLLPFNFFAEALGRAPSAIVAQPNYVKKVVFPLALLPMTIVLTALTHAGIGLALLVAAQAACGKLSLWVLIVPLAWLPLVILTLGLAWFFAALGVFLRDTGQLMGMALSALLFLSPVFYPASALPETLRPWLLLNPLTVPIETMRAVLIERHAPDWSTLAAYFMVALFIGWLGWRWFEKTRKGFADVL